MGQGGADHRRDVLAGVIVKSGPSTIIEAMADSKRLIEVGILKNLGTQGSWHDS